MSVNKPASLVLVGFALAVGFLAAGDAGTAHAQPGCVDLPTNGIVQLCISLEPESATNQVGTNHTVTATVTADGQPSQDEEVAILVDSGPNANEFAEGLTNASGQFALTYPGDSGPGTDNIIACITDLAAQELCFDFGTQPPFVEDVATKEWVQPATPTPAPTAPATAAATPTPRATAVPAAQLPTTGASPAGGGSGFVWVALIAVAAAVSTGAALAYTRRRVR
jgi:hypothetical protein